MIMNHNQRTDTTAVICKDLFQVAGSGRETEAQPERRTTRPLGVSGVGNNARPDSNNWKNDVDYMTQRARYEETYHVCSVIAL